MKILITNKKINSNHFNSNVNFGNSNETPNLISFFKDKDKDVFKSLKEIVEKTQSTEELSLLGIEELKALKLANDGLDDVINEKTTTIELTKQELQSKANRVKEQSKSIFTFENLVNKKSKENKFKNNRLSSLSTQLEELDNIYKKSTQQEYKKQIAFLEDLHSITLNKIIEQINNPRLKVDKTNTLINRKIPGGLIDIIGYDKEKELLINMFGKPLALDLQKKNVSIPGGIVLFGPDGKSKELFAHSFANQFKCDFYEISTNGRSRLKKLRKILAASKLKYEKEGARSIIYIKYFDKFASSKNLLATGIMKGVMDIISKDYHSTIIAATTTPEKIDDILLRDGRFDVKVAIPPAPKEFIQSIIKKNKDRLKLHQLEIEKILSYFSFDNQQSFYSISQVEALIKSRNKNSLFKKLNKLTPQINKNMIEQFTKQIIYMKKR